MSESIDFLCQFIISNFQNEMSQKEQDEISSSIKKFIQKSISFDECQSICKKLVGETAPIERLNEIMQSSSIPIPYELSSEEKQGNRRKSRTWTPLEDNRLVYAIYQYGIESWTAISKFVGNGRTRSQCSQRWYRGLNPSISKQHWTPEEEKKLIELVQVNGEKSWTLIANKLGHRNDVQCRYRYKQIMKEQNILTNSMSLQNNFIANSSSQRQINVIPQQTPCVSQIISPPISSYSILNKVSLSPQFPNISQFETAPTVSDLISQLHSLLNSQYIQSTTPAVHAIQNIPAVQTISNLSPHITPSLITQTHETKSSSPHSIETTSVLTPIEVLYQPTQITNMRKPTGIYETVPETVAISPSIVSPIFSPSIGGSIQESPLYSFAASTTIIPETIVEQNSQSRVPKIQTPSINVSSYSVY